MRGVFRRAAGAAAVMMLFVAACRGTQTAAAESKPADPIRAAAEQKALRAVESPIEILASRVEVLLPAGLYGRDDLPLVVRQSAFYKQQEFPTALGHRVSLRAVPDAGPPPARQLGRVELGKWRLYGTAAVELLFSNSPDLHGARLTASGVELVKHGDDVRRNVARVQFDGESLTVSKE